MATAGGVCVHVHVWGGGRGTPLEEVNGLLVSIT